MNEETAWLPPLVLLAEYEGDVGRYLEAVYQVFRADFVDSRPLMAGMPCGLRNPDLIEGKEGTFWHIISEGKIEEERLPDLRRCDRIRWPRPVIESVGNDRIRCWQSKRNGDQRVQIATKEFSYLVVLLHRKSYVLLLTAFPVEKERRRAKLRKDYETATKS